MLDAKGPGAWMNFHPWLALDKLPGLHVNLQGLNIGKHSIPPFVSLKTVHSLQPRQISRIIFTDLCLQ